jgi:hypothetical protein
MWSHHRAGTQLTPVVSTVNSAVLSACSAIGASSGVPGVTVVAVGVSAGDVGPAPVGVEHDLTSLGGTASTSSTGASLPGKGGVSLGSDSTGLLSAGGSEERERSEGEVPVHGRCCEKNRCWMLRLSGRGRMSYIEASWSTLLHFLGT